MGNKLKSPINIGHLSLSDSSTDDYLYVQGVPIKDLNLENELVDYTNAIICTFNITSENTTISLKNLIGVTKIIWGDGTSDISLTHTYLMIGQYTCLIFGVTEIGFAAFYQCSNLVKIQIPRSINLFGASCLSEARLTEIEIPEGTTFIPDFMLGVNLSLETVVLPSTVSALGIKIFRADTNLKKIVIKAVTPPTITSDTFEDTTCPIYVPLQSLSAYQTAGEGWENYTDRIVAIVDTNYIAANPTGTSSTDLTKLEIGGAVYNIPSGGGSGGTKQYLHIIEFDDSGTGDTQKITLSCISSSSTPIVSGSDIDANIAKFQYQNVGYFSYSSYQAFYGVLTLVVSGTNIIGNIYSADNSTNFSIPIAETWNDTVTEL